MSQTKESGVISVQMLNEHFPNSVTKEYSNQERIEGDNLLFNKYKVELKHAEFAKRVGNELWSKTFNQIRSYCQLPILCTVTSKDKKEVHFFGISPESMFKYCQDRKRGQHTTIPEESVAIRLNGATRKYFQKIETREELIAFFEDSCVVDEKRYEHIDLVETTLREMGNILNMVRNDADKGKKEEIRETLSKLKNSICK